MSKKPHKQLGISSHFAPWQIIHVNPSLRPQKQRLKVKVPCRLKLSWQTRARTKYTFNVMNIATEQLCNTSISGYSLQSFPIRNGKHLNDRMLLSRDNWLIIIRGEIRFSCNKREHSPPTNVARFRFLDSASYVGWRFVAGSCPCSERLFSGYSGFPLYSKTMISKFQFDLKSVLN